MILLRWPLQLFPLQLSPTDNNNDDAGNNHSNNDNNGGGGGDIIALVPRRDRIYFRCERFGYLVAAKNLLSLASLIGSLCAQPVAVAAPPNGRI